MRYDDDYDYNSRSSRNGSRRSSSSRSSGRAHGFLNFFHRSAELTLLFQIGRAHV